MRHDDAVVGGDRETAMIESHRFRFVGVWADGLPRLTARRSSAKCGYLAHRYNARTHPLIPVDRSGRLTVKTTLRP